MILHDAFTEHVHMINNGMLRNKVYGIFMVHLENDGNVVTSHSYDFDNNADIYKAIGAVESLKHKLLAMIEQDDED